MAIVNMNTLHLHANDDEAWRIEIPSLPELTKYGGFRCSHYPSECLEPAYGSGPLKSASTNGYLSEDEYSDLLFYARSRGISIILEINGPGHARAAIMAMKKRNDPRYCLHDPQQKTFDVESVQHFTGNIMNPCMDSTYEFLETVIKYLRKAVFKLSLDILHNVI